MGYFLKYIIIFIQKLEDEEEGGLEKKIIKKQILLSLSSSSFGYKRDTERERQLIWMCVSQNKKVWYNKWREWGLLVDNQEVRVAGDVGGRGGELGSGSQLFYYGATDLNDANGGSGVCLKMGK